MKSSQVGLVILLLIGLGVAGLVARAVSAGSDESVLSGLLPISPDVVDGVTIRTSEEEVMLVRQNQVWRVGSHQAFDPKLAQLWSVVDSFDGAQLIALNPDNHERMGVDLANGAEVIFFIGGAVQERFIVGGWSPNVRLCYLRRQASAPVYGVPCPGPDVFDTSIDGWRNPIVLGVPRDQIADFTFKYFEDREVSDEFVVDVQDNLPVLSAGDAQMPANPLLAELLLRSVEILVASGFAADDEAGALDFDFPDASLLVGTKPDGRFPTSRLLFIKREDGDYYVRNTAKPSVYIVDGALVERFLRPRSEFLGQ